MKLTGLKRNSIDQFYTHPEVAHSLIQTLNSIVPLSSFDTLIESSAGDGAFLIPLLQIHPSVLAYDIDPHHSQIIQADFLLQKFPIDKSIAVIGNPPFGRQSSLAKKFIKYSCSFASLIAFILPKSFKKASMIRVFDLSFHKIYEKNLDKTSFLVNGNTHDVPCVFQIWQKKDTLREIEPREIENESSYKFVKKHESPDQSHYFLQLFFTNPQYRESLNCVQWDTDNTVGPRSISKQELIQHLNQICD